MRTSAGLPRLALTRIRKGAAMNQQVQPNTIAPVAAVTPDAIMQLGFAFWGSKTLLSAIELGLFTLLADERRGVDHTAQAASAQRPRFPRCTCRARPTRAPRRALFQYAGGRAVSRSPQADLCGRHTRNGKRAALSILGLAN